MKKGLLLLTLAVLMGVVSCVKDVVFSSEEQEMTYTAKEARAFFEEYVKSYDTHRSRNSGNNVSLFEFHLSPDWRSAKGSNNDELFSIDVPTISPGRTVLAWRGNNLYYVHVVQKLVMVKRSSDEQQGAYLLTLIPEQGYARWYKQMDASVFVNTGDKAGYSGLAVYTLALTDQIMRVDRYVDGLKVEGYGLFGTPDENAAAAVDMYSLLEGIKFRIGIAAVSRSGESIPCQDIDSDEVELTPPGGGSGGSGGSSGGGSGGSTGGGSGSGSSGGGGSPDPDPFRPPPGSIVTVKDWLRDRNINSNFLSYKLLIHYTEGNGSTYFLSPAEWSSVKSAAESLLGANYMTGAKEITINGNIYYKKVVNFITISTLDIGLAIGDATVFFTSDGTVVGLRDEYDFFERAGRSWYADLSTYFGALLKGTIFSVRYGVYD
ncbi:MAG: hypothetical protein FWE10_08320 [Rikenellaceae bacterium]|nr:hypothetical protein [Rikenellaceae bacterium]